jgi:hypothetical protein
MRLCYRDQAFWWFTDTPVSEVWGDDWDDAPYEHNASEPYAQYGPFTKIAIDYALVMPGNGFVNSEYSVQDINNGKVCWGSTYKWDDKQLVIPAGIELSELTAKLRELKIDYYVRAE